MDTYPYLTVFRQEGDGYFVCGCGEYDVNIDRMNLHVSKKIQGVCINGMSLGSKSIYKCVCGKEFGDAKESKLHFIKKYCMANKLEKLNRTCSLCNFVCRSEYDLKLHETSKTHLAKVKNSSLVLECKPCNIKCSTENQITLHLKSKKHLKNITPKEKVEKSTYCKTCDINFSSTYGLGIHVNSKKHQRSEDCIEILPLKCEVCNITCSSQPQIRKHLQTKKHKDMVASGKVAEEIIPLDCEVCKIKCPSQKTMRAHLETKKHKKLLGINNISQSIDS
jgi:hypothetical protein